MVLGDCNNFRLADTDKGDPGVSTVKNESSPGTTDDLFALSVSAGDFSASTIGAKINTARVPVNCKAAVMRKVKT